MLPVNTAFHVVFEFREAGDVKTAKAHDASTANVDETLRRANFHRLIHELAGAVKATNDVHRNKHLTKALNKAREAVSVLRRCLFCGSRFAHSKGHCTVGLQRRH